ncbi:MAG: hypothetical protein JXN64_04750 [Spirochaetes bacterium]|nr:hypothetical protein [Spirochaetota bacterium]
MNKTNSGLNIHLENWLREVFELPASAFIEIAEEDYTDKEGSLNQKTDFKIQVNNKKFNTYTILKPTSQICFDDIIFLKQSFDSYVSKYFSMRSKIYKFFGWWFIFAGGITIFSVCPICGQTGCPVGVGTTGILAGILSLVKISGKNCINYLKISFKSIHLKNIILHIYSLILR